MLKVYDFYTMNLTKSGFSENPENHLYLNVLCSIHGKISELSFLFPSKESSLLNKAEDPIKCMILYMCTLKDEINKKWKLTNKEYQLVVKGVKKCYRKHYLKERGILEYLREVLKSLLNKLIGGMR